MDWNEKRWSAGLVPVPAHRVGYQGARSERGASLGKAPVLAGEGMRRVK